MRRLTWILIGLMALLSACSTTNKQGGAASAAANGADATLQDGLYAVIQTNKGDFTCRLEYNKAPVTVANFVGLAEGQLDNTIKESGVPYFDNITFHRVINDFMVQGGDPNTLEGGDPAQVGRGGPGYFFQDEIDPSLRHNVPGTLSMANMGPYTNGSQFFVTHKATPWLDGKHTVFGYVVRNLNTVYKVAQNDTIRHIEIERIGAAAEAFDAVAVFQAQAKPRNM